jgi:hypothetical protein
MILYILLRAFPSSRGKKPPQPEGKTWERDWLILGLRAHSNSLGLSPDFISSCLLPAHILLMQKNHMQVESKFKDFEITITSTGILVRV